MKKKIEIDKIQNIKYNYNREINRMEVMLDARISRLFAQSYRI